ncbi:nuclear receptor coactivator 7 [Hypomesus transpacificus]|uniref:nuclear receptor coactivator 7 n=1 Tax=Hypomesus transpacificus TaxID=137520 RepID=UPI001F07B75D|nr:nuclear receptor coactivator 7 [Hypomesus transpacificus]
MENKLQRDKTRPSYFGNVKTRLGSKLPSGVSQPPGFISCPWETQPQACTALEGSSQCHNYHSGASRPLDHVPHIRNPRLRQYYLQGTTWEPGGLTAKPFEEKQQSSGIANSLRLPEDTVFSITSEFNNPGASDVTKMNRPPSSFSCSSLLSTASSSSLISRQHLRVPMGKAFNQGSSPPPPPPPPPTNLDHILGLAPELKSNPGTVFTPLACPHSPSPDVEYDKLLDVEAVPMPDGQLCLLALPPECSEGEGPEAMPYLKLFCRSITDRKGVVSGILLVTAKKIFFDPCKTHPLVMEHGCEEYLLSCSVDALASISFFSDISHVHFNTSTHRWKGKKTTPKSKPVSRPQDGNTGHSSLPHHKGETVPALVSAATSNLRSSLTLSLSKGGSEEEEEEGADRESRDEAERQREGSPLEELAVQSAGPLGVAVLSSAATFCCGGQETAGNKVKMELVHLNDKEKEFHLKNQTSSSRTFPGSSGGLMFIRMRVHRSSGKKKSLGSKTLPWRDNWFTLSQESSDELYAYLSHWRPDLCILEGGVEEEEEEGEEEEFVLVNDREEEGEEEELDMSQKCGRMVEDWEMVSAEDGGERSAMVIDPEGLAEIVEQSRILEASHVRELSAELPPRTVGHPWKLAYSTSHHGSSLRSLYRRLNGTDAPVLVIIKDALNQVFGSFLSHPLRPSEKFYGTGETFLFMLHPRFKCFKWTGENSFFIKGDLDSFAIGGGSGHFGLWLDETLYLGRSSPCYTFNNCCLSETDDFQVMELEVWTFC